MYADVRFNDGLAIDSVKRWLLLVNADQAAINAGYALHRYAGSAIFLFFPIRPIIS